MPRGSISSASSPSPAAEDSSHFPRAKTVLALTVVVGCFAILWPKIFYPMLTASLPGGGSSAVGPGSGAGGPDGDSKYFQVPKPFASQDKFRFKSFQRKNI